MQKPEHHFIVCASFRNGGGQQGVCHKRGSVNLIQYLENETADRGIDAAVTGAGCLKFCEKGPVMVVYPAGSWYGEVDERKIDTVLDAVEAGRAPDLAQLG